MAESRRTVLIVDDSGPCATNLEIALGGIPNIEVEVKGNGREALEYLESHPQADLRAMLTDLQMPQMDGFELIREVRARERYAGVPIIVLTGDPDPRTREQLNDLRLAAHFRKPYSLLAVRQCVEQILNDPPGMP